MWPLLTSAGQEGRKYILSGLGSTTFVGEVDNEDHLSARERGPPPGPAGGAMNWRMVVKQMNSSSTLKLICCPKGCDGFNGNATLWPKSTGAQVGLFEIS